jgi:PAS domain S-box-containing protein
MAIRGEKEFDTEYRIVWPDGSIHHIRAFAIVNRDKVGNPLHMIGTNWDITAQKQAKEALAVEKQRLASIIKGTDVGTWEWNIQTGETIFNERWAEILGYSLDEISPVSIETWMKYAHPEDLKISGELLEKHFRKEIDYYSVESRMKHKTGKWVWVLDRGKVHKWDNEGKPLLMSGTHQEITERKLVEEEIIKARIEAEEANLAKSEFLSRMSHELRTPMNSILGFAQLIEMGEIIPGHRKGINHILNSGKHLLNLINEILDISKIEAGRISLSMEPVNLKNTILEMLDIVQPQAESKKLSIKLLESPTNRLSVIADNQRLKQVLLNLINNAIKYNRKGGSVEIKTEQKPSTSKANSKIRISVIDTGIGIRPEEINKLFLPFERIGAERTETEGTGLGLTVVKKLMDAMGGSLGVESIPGGGSTFWIELMMSKNKLKTNKEVKGTKDANTKDPKILGTILYIEDNASNIELLEQIIAARRPDIRLISNPTGGNALTLALEHSPDIILLDLNLPDIHGSKVLENLKQDVTTKSIPVVVISADAMPHQVEKLIKIGATKYLTKPLHVLDYLKVIDEYIGR